MVEESLNVWPGEFIIANNDKVPHEAKMLYLVIDKAIKELDWEPYWDFTTTIQKQLFGTKKS